MRAILLSAALGTCVPAALGQLIVANDQSTASGPRSIYHIDVTTGVATPIYTSSDASSAAWGMAYDPATNTLYWNNGGILYRSPFSLSGLTPTAMGQLTFNSTNTNYVGLAWHNGQLLGTRNIATEAVYSIDLNTLSATLIWAYNTAFDFGGLDADATTSRLFGLSDTAPAGSVRGLYEIDLNAQTTTFLAGYPGTETDIDGLAVHDGKAYYVSDGPNTVQAEFYIYDIATGTQIGSLPSPFTGSGTFSAAAFIAEGGPACYANCDGSTTPPILNVADFTCFLTKFAALDPYANCDGSTIPPVHNVADFTCFLTKFAAGC
jgi:hypothetical protein